MRRIPPYGDDYGRFLRKCNIDTAKIVAPRKRSTGQAFALSRPFRTEKIGGMVEWCKTIPYGPDSV